jgi:hypothetical protein
MKLLIGLLFFILIICTINLIVYPQENSVNAKFLLNKTTGAGYGTAFGAALNFNITIPQKFVPKVVYVANIEAVNAPKLYVGDKVNIDYKLRNKIRIYPQTNFFGEVGYQLGYYSTSQYTKKHYAFTAGAGYNLQNKYIFSYTYQFPDMYKFSNGSGQKVGNNLRGHNINFDLFYPLSQKSKWQIVATYGFGMYKFEQPKGFANEGTHNVKSFTMMLGFGRRFVK